MNHSKETLLLELASIFSKQLSYVATVSQALRLICNSFSFSCGLIYELDEMGTYKLKKPPSHNCLNMPGSLDFGKDHFDIFQEKENNHLLYIQKDSPCTGKEHLLLSQFSTSGLFAYSVLDEYKRSIGLIVFLQDSHMSSHDLEVLSILFPLLGHYVEAQMLKDMHELYHNSLDNILDNIGIDIYANDFYTHEILYVNKSMAAPYGGIDAFKGKRCWEVLYPGQAGPCEFCPEKELLDENGIPSRIYSWNYQRPFDGSWFRVFSVAFRWMDGRLAHMVSSADITENKKNEELIEYMANYDVLTGLPNRRQLMQDCENKLSQTANGIAYLLFFDIDGFKSINDNFGHDSGDEFLIKLATFFSEIPLLKNSTYRNGGDEFVALIDSENISKKEIENLIHLIHKRFEEPWTLKNGSASCNVSVGVACYPEDGSTAEGLLQKADQAMYYTKRQGGASFCFGFQLDKKEI